MAHSRKTRVWIFAKHLHFPYPQSFTWEEDVAKRTSRANKRRKRALRVGTASGLTALRQCKRPTQPQQLQAAARKAGARPAQAEAKKRQQAAERDRQNAAKPQVRRPRLLPCCHYWRTVNEPRSNGLVVHCVSCGTGRRRSARRRRSVGRLRLALVSARRPFVSRRHERERDWLVKG
jgi:hypothetical protein